MGRFMERRSEANASRLKGAEWGCREGSLGVKACCTSVRTGVRIPAPMQMLGKCGGLPRTPALRKLRQEPQRKLTS